MSFEETEKEEKKQPRPRESTMDLLGNKVKTDDIQNIVMGGLVLGTAILGLKVFAPGLLPFNAPTPPIIEEKKKEPEVQTAKVEKAIQEVYDQDPLEDVVDRIYEEPEINVPEKQSIPKLPTLDALGSKGTTTPHRLSRLLKREKLDYNSIDDLY